MEIVFLGGGLSFCDFDDDGWDDITFSTDDTKQIYFFKNNNGSFSEVDYGINVIGEGKQVTWVDYDNDGDKDFISLNVLSQNKFYRNDGNMTFTDVTSSIGLFNGNLHSYGASFGDN